MPRDGVWNMRNHQFCSGVRVDKWAVAVCGRPPKDDEIDVIKSVFTVPYFQLLTNSV